MTCPPEGYSTFAVVLAVLVAYMAGGWTGLMAMALAAAAKDEVQIAPQASEKKEPTP